jgi:hypothetical protein
MLSTPDGPFINLARLNFAKYASRQNLAKALFEYIFHHENDVRNVSTTYISPKKLFGNMLIGQFFDCCSSIQIS